MRKAIIFSLLIGFLLLAFTVSADQPRYVIPLSSSKIVRLRNNGGSCSGFFASPHVVITAAHCVVGGKPELESGEKLKVLYAGEVGTASDYAICWTDKEHAEWLKLRASDLLQSDPLTQVSRNPETFALPLSYIGNYVDGSFMVRGRVRPGDSGSAVLDADNYVVGITFAYIPATGDTGFLAPIGQVIKKLDELKVQPPPQPWSN